MPDGKGWEYSGAEPLETLASCIVFRLLFVLLCTSLMAEINHKVWIEYVIPSYALTY